ncbi:MAG: cation:proton antiporter [Candidatus Saccharicenans sp.]|nr:cation:proton antiporter [Candidatus Saccharicenans sp.]
MCGGLSRFEAYLTAAIRLSLALLASILASRLKISMALMEITVGALAGYLVVRYFGESALSPNADWLRFVAGSGAILLTFLAGAKPAPQSLRAKLKESTVIDFIGFLAPSLGCTIIARYLLHRDWRASLLAGIALSTTSMAVVYSVMLESGFNKTEFGKGVLGSCFVNDPGTVIGLGLIFAPFTYRTAVFVIVSTMVFIFLPGMTERIIKNTPSKPPPLAPNGSFSGCSAWKRSPCGRKAKRCCRLTSSAWSWPERSAATAFSSGPSPR